MPREAKLFASSAGSAVRGYLKFRANIPPRWIRNARTSRKRIELEVDGAFRLFMRLRRPNNRFQHSGQKNNYHSAQIAPRKLSRTLIVGPRSRVENFHNGTSSGRVLIIRRSRQCLA